MTPPILRQQFLHPDALFDMKYETKTLDISAYLGNPEDHAGDVRIQGRSLQVESVGEGILRIRAGLPGAQIEPSVTEKLGLVNAKESQVLAWTQTADGLQADAGDLRFEMDRTSGAFRVTRGAIPLWQTVEGGLRFSEETPDHGGQRFYCESVVEPDEHFFGFGGRIAPSDRRGQTVDIYSVKTGKVSGDYGGFPVPFFLSTKGYGIFLNNPWPHVYFDMACSEPDRWWVHAPGGDCDFFFIEGPGFADIVRRYTALTGRTPVVPRWLLGFWCSSLLFNSAEQAVKDADRLRAEGYPCDVFVFDGPWRGGKDFAAMYQQKQEYPSNDMDWHPDFGDGPAMIRELARRGIKTSLHLNSRNFRPETTERGVAAGLLRKHGEEVVVRVTHEPSETFYAEMITPRVRDEIALWWTDHSDRLSGELAPGLPSRNLFGVLWNRLLTQVMENHGITGHLSLSRGGGIGSQRYAIPWPGDTRCGMDALADDIWFMLSAGLAGFTLSSADLGGFVPRKDPLKDYPSPEAVLDEMFDEENLCRRVFHCLLFTPIPRIHNNWATPPKLPWNCPENVRTLYRAALEERYRLTPYLYSYVLRAAETGEPLLRPLPYHFPNDADAIAATTQFTIGEWLMAAPVVEAGRTTQSVYLPAGLWTDVWTGQQHQGPARIEVDAPLHELRGLPLFARAGAIIPRQTPVPYLTTQPPETLEVEVFRGADGDFAMYESPGQSLVFSLREDGLTVENRTEHVRETVIHGSNPRFRSTISVAPGETRHLSFDEK